MQLLLPLLALASTPLTTAFPLSSLFRRVTDTTTYAGAFTSDDVLNGVCAPLTLVFARGTGEPGNIGAIIGPELGHQLSVALNKHVAIQGVHYAADIAGDVDFGSEGGPNMTAVSKQALSQCPSTKLVLGGYSQGGLVTHYALNHGLDASTVAAVVLFGDPEYGFNVGSVPANKVKNICANGDGVCDRKGSITEAHLSYSSDANSVAQWILQTAGVTNATATAS